MSETTGLEATARAERTAGLGGDQPTGRDVSWYWIASAPLLLLGLFLFAWGLALLFALPLPGRLPPLPAGMGGIDLVATGTVLLVGPPGVRFVLDDRRKRRLESQFPDFLTDMAANRRAGFTLAESVGLASGGDYGPLTPYVERMSAQLSWNVPFEEALQRFARSVDTPLVTRATSLVLEAERSGGHITDVLTAVARDARELRHLDRERLLAMRAYTLVMYVTFLVFLGVVAVLQAQLLPQLATATTDSAGGLFPTGSVPADEHRTFFYTASIVQALGSGTMAGVMGRGRVGPGLVHAAAMTLLTVLTFSFLLV